MHQGSSDPDEARPPGEATFTATTTRRRRAPLAVAVAAIAFLGLAVVIKEVAPGPGLPTPTKLPRAPVAVASFGPPVEPTAEPTASPTSDPPSRDPAATPYPTFVTVPATAGRTQLVPAHPINGTVTITLPGGWRQAGPDLYVKQDDSGPVGLSIGAYVIEHVNMFPCRWASGAVTDTAYPHTAAGLALALSAFWGQDPNLTPFFSNSSIAPIATKPRPATIGGAPAWALQILIPSVLDFSACDGGQLVLWETVDGTVRYGLGPGEIDRLWVVDVQDDLVVIDAALPLLATPKQEAELQAIVDSVAIGP